MATLGIRHAVLWVTDPVASADSYTAALGLEVKHAGDGRAFLVQIVGQGYANL